MSSRPTSSLRLAVSSILFSFAVAGLPAIASAQEKKTPKPKAAAKAPGKSAAKSPGAATQFDKHLAANMKFLNVLSRYAECLAGATDTTTATLAASQIEEITREVITAGEAVVKLGRPAPELEARLAKDADLQLTSQLVAEKTRAAVKTISENGEVKTTLAPAIENFQAALNRIQQTAEDPQGPGGSSDKKPETAGALPSPAVDPGLLPAKPAGDTAAVAPPPTPQ